jgi:hypothetical protein
VERPVIVDLKITTDMRTHLEDEGLQRGILMKVLARDALRRQQKGPGGRRETRAGDRWPYLLVRRATAIPKDHLLISAPC